MGQICQLPHPHLSRDLEAPVLRLAWLYYCPLRPVLVRGLPPAQSSHSLQSRSQLLGLRVPLLQQHHHLLTALQVLVVLYEYCGPMVWWLPLSVCRSSRMNWVNSLSVRTMMSLP